MDMPRWWTEKEKKRKIYISRSIHSHRAAIAMEREKFISNLRCLPASLLLFDHDDVKLSDVFQ